MPGGKQQQLVLESQRQEQEHGTSAPSSSSTTKIIHTRLQIFGRNVTPPAGRCIKEEKKGKGKKNTIKYPLEKKINSK